MDLDRRSILYYYFDYNYTKNKFKKIFTSFLKLFFKKEIIDGDFSDATFFNSNKRKDHTLLFDSVFDSYNGKKSLINYRKKLNFNPSSIFIFIKYLLNFKKISKILKDKLGKKYSFFCLIYIIIMLSYDQYIINFYNSNYDFKLKIFVVLYDLGRVESNLIKAIRIKDKNVKIISLQHGLFIPSENIENIDMLNYFDCAADYVLTWGDSSKRIFSNYGTKAITCGNPIIKKKYCMEENYIGIALDIPRNKKFNQELINIATKYAMKNLTKVKVRIHPLDNILNYNINEEYVEFNFDIDNSKFILTHTSTMTFIYMFNGKKVYKYKTSIPFFKLDKEIEFSNLEELEKVLKISYSYKKIIDDFIMCNGDYSKKLYNKAIKEIIEKNN